MAEVAQHNTTYPGKGLSIAGMVVGICAVVFSVWLGFLLGILAIIFSAIGLKRKKNGFAITGLVTGIIGTIISIFVGIILVIAAYAGVTAAAHDASVAASASTVQKRAELFNANYNAYPSFEEMQNSLSALDTAITIDRQGVGSSGDVIYIPCYGEGAIIWYWSGVDDEYKSLYVGATDSCEWNE